MTYDFFADITDKIEILDFIFKEIDLRVYDLASAYGEEICEYRNTTEITSKFDLNDGGQFAATFQLWAPRHKGQPLFRKIDLNPKYCNGHTFRYSTDGWGLIQLYFGGLKSKELYYSHIGHFNEKGALKNEGSNSFNGKVSDWDWTEIQATSRKLKYHLHNKMATRKSGTYDIFGGADRLEKQGFNLHY